MPISEKAASRGCYELRLGNDSILAWLLENHTQVTFPAKSGRLLPLIWRSFEKTLHSATTSCARSSTGSEVDCENRLCLALYATRPATLGSCLPADEEVALWAASSKRWSTICAYSCAFRRAGRPIRRRRYSTLALYAPPRSVALGAVTTARSARRARRFTRRWILWGTCSPCSSVRPQNRSELGWASWPRPCKKRPANRWSLRTWMRATPEGDRPKKRRLMA